MSKNIDLGKMPMPYEGGPKTCPKCKYRYAKGNDENAECPKCAGLVRESSRFASTIAKMSVETVSLVCANADCRKVHYFPIHAVPERLLHCQCGEASAVPAAALRLKIKKSARIFL